MDRYEISKYIIDRLNYLDLDLLRAKFCNSGKINYLVIDNLLPNKLAEKLNDIFPDESELSHLKMIQQNKFVGVNFDKSQYLIEECLYAFQQDEVLRAVSMITNIEDIVGDPELYAGGISSMSKGCFLNPHIDNSHDRKLKKFRRLNLLYYVNNNWDPIKDGGELLLFPDGIKNKEVKITCNFNRLVIMRTDNRSLHAVRKIHSKDNRRKCISNYYFSEKSPLGKNYYHSTSFKGFKNEYLKSFILKLNGKIKTSTKYIIYKLFNKSISTNMHKEIE